MSGGGGGGGDSETTIRYADYIESKHKDFLDEVHDRRENVIDLSPFTGYTPIEYANGFFGAGYFISDFPSLYDMFGKFVAGLDIEALFTQILNDSVNNTAIDNLVSAHATELSDDIIQNADPRFSAGMRDINSVISSSFVIGRSLMESARTKAISKYDAGLRAQMIQIAASRWQTHLEWNKQVVLNYAEIMKFYFSTAMDLDNHNLTMIVKDRLWPFTVLDYERACLGVLQGATNANSEVAGASQTQKVIGGALTGAAGGAMIGATTGGAFGLPGAVVGGIAGGLLGAASGFL
jgi:hypothetical protein